VNVSQIATLVMRQSDDSSGASFAPASPPNDAPPELVRYMNEAQQLACLLTLCLEKTASFPIGPNLSIDGLGCFYWPRPVLTDWLVPLKITCNGNRVRPATLYDMQAENESWQNAAGDPARYAALGFNLLAITPQSSGTLVTTYARTADLLINDQDVPELFEQYHHSIVDYCVYRVRLKEGAQGLARGLERFNLFLDDMTKLADYIRARTAAARYDVTPFELALMDRSRLIGQLLGNQLKGITSQAAMWKRRLSTERY